MDAVSFADREVGDMFLSVLCADPELVQAEFDAIVGANWGPLPPAEMPAVGAVPSPRSWRAASQCWLPTPEAGDLESRVGAERGPPE